MQMTSDNQGSPRRQGSSALSPHGGQDQMVALSARRGCLKRTRSSTRKVKVKSEVVTLAWPATRRVSPVLQAGPTLHLAPHDSPFMAVPSLSSDLRPSWTTPVTVWCWPCGRSVHLSICPSLSLTCRPLPREARCSVISGHLCVPSTKPSAQDAAGIGLNVPTE